MVLFAGMSERFETGNSLTKFSNSRWRVASTEVFTPDGMQVWNTLISNAPAVVIVPVNDEGKIAVVTQNRILEDGNTHLVSEFVSGWMETKTRKVSLDQIKEDANRELQEEIGVKAQTLELLAQFRLGNFAAVPYYVLLATNLEESKLPGDDGERIDVEWLTLVETEQRLIKDQVPTAQVLIALQAYKNR
jgi:8-oxo-dGTP pyrophosphatase MutT (NUDIX family)